MGPLRYVPQTLNEHTSSESLQQPLVFGHRWSGCAFETFLPVNQLEADLYKLLYRVEPGDRIARATGPQIPTALPDNEVQSATRFVWEMAPEASGSPFNYEFRRGFEAGGVLLGAVDGSEYPLLAEDVARGFLTSIGPLSPYVYSTDRAWLLAEEHEKDKDKDWLDFPLAPTVEGLKVTLSEAAELRQAFEAVRARTSGAGLGSIRDKIEAGPFAVQAVERFERASLSGSIKSGDLAFVRTWVRNHIERRGWALRVSDSDGAPRLIPWSIADLLWLAIGEALGAAKLRPGVPTSSMMLDFCGHCEMPVFSRRARKSGKRVFCDPPVGRDRSVCANRFFSRLGKERLRERTRANVEAS
jgi:hypothetical protein